MADDVTFQPVVATPPDGTVVATDDVAGAHYQRVKLDVGGDGASIPVVGVAAVEAAANMTGSAINARVANYVYQDDWVPWTGAVAGIVVVEQATAASLNAAVQGNEAHNAVDTGNPVKIGGRAVTNAAEPPPAAVATGDRVDAWYDTLGIQQVSIRDSTGGEAVVVQEGGALTVALQGITPVQGNVAHDQDASGVFPLLVGGFSSAAAPASVSADAEAVRAWFLRNGAQATALTAAGALIGGDAANGLDVDVTRLPATSSAGPANVAASATSVTLIASNANRKGATVFNDSVSNLYVKLGATASATSFHVILGPNGYYEVPFGYTGIIDGIWVSATGSARVGEFTT